MVAHLKAAAVSTTAAPAGVSAMYPGPPLHIMHCSISHQPSEHGSFRCARATRSANSVSYPTSGIPRLAAPKYCPSNSRVAQACNVLDTGYGETCTSAKLTQMEMPHRIGALSRPNGHASDGCSWTHASDTRQREERGEARLPPGAALEQALQGQPFAAAAVQVDHRAAVIRVQHLGEGTEEACAADSSPLAPWAATMLLPQRTGRAQRRCAQICASSASRACFRPDLSPRLLRLETAVCTWPGLEDDAQAEARGFRRK